MMLWQQISYKNILHRKWSFKASLEQRLEELTNNHTALHESFIKSEAEQRKLRLILQELENNCSALQTRYSANVQEQTILKNTVENLTQSHATLSRPCYVAVCNNYAICNKLQTALNCNAVCNTLQTAFRI